VSAAAWWKADERLDLHALECIAALSASSISEENDEEKMIPPCASCSCELAADNPRQTQQQQQHAVGMKLTP
jgi:hypothetical protein